MLGRDLALFCSVALYHRKESDGRNDATESTGSITRLLDTIQTMRSISDLLY